MSDVDVLRKLLDNLEFSSDSMYVGDLADNLIDMGFQVRRSSITFEHPLSCLPVAG